MHLVNVACQHRHFVLAVGINRLGQVAGGNSANMGNDLMQRLQQHVAHGDPAGDNHRHHNHHNGREDPQDTLVVVLVIGDARAGQLRLRLTPFAVYRLHRHLLLLGILLEHIVQLALGQQLVHFRQRGVVSAILLFQPLRQLLIHARCFRQGIIFVVMALRLGQQRFCGSDQLTQLRAVDLGRRAALQTEHAAVKGNARLVQADPRVGKLCHVLAGQLGDGEIVLIIIQGIDKNCRGDDLHQSEHQQYRD